jgi:hypothetical protein
MQAIRTVDAVERSISIPFLTKMLDMSELAGDWT